MLSNDGCMNESCLSFAADVEMIQTIANISMERIQQQGIPATPTPATPTPATPTTDLSMDNTDGEKRNKSQMPDVSRRLTKEGDGPLDPTVLIKRLRNAYRTPDNVPVSLYSQSAVCVCVCVCLYPSTFCTASSVIIRAFVLFGKISFMFVLTNFVRMCG